MELDSTNDKPERASIESDGYRLLAMDVEAWNRWKEKEKEKREERMKEVESAAIEQYEVRCRIQ